MLFRSAFAARGIDPREAPLKLDVRDAWCSDGSGRAPLKDWNITVFDWKGSGTASQARALRAAFPQVIFEDPPIEAAGGLGPIAWDRPLTSSSALAALPSAAYVNLKIPRCGGVLETLTLAEAAKARGSGIYFGGMHEVGVGRHQARALAALLCAEATNDLALLNEG